MKVYLLAYDEDLSEKSLLKFLDTRREISDWMTILPSSILFVSNRSPRQLTNLLNKKYPSAQFIVIEVDTRRTDGMLPEECWNFINE
jgi:hypothetical protein